MKITVDNETLGKIEALANMQGMFGRDFIRMVLRDVLSNEEHYKYYTRLAQETVQKKIERDREILFKKYGKKK